LSDVNAAPHGTGFRLSALLEQTQPGPAFQLQVPLAVQLKDQANAWQTSVTMADKELRLALDVPGQPERLAVDPEFDLMRRLHPLEAPPTLSALFGAEQALIVVPAGESRALREAYEKTARAWQAEYDAEIIWDDALAALPAQRSVWLFGWENRFREAVRNALSAEPPSVVREEQGAVFVARHPDAPEQTLAWAAWDSPERFERMAQKLRHYGKYSYLVFSDEQARNVAKGQWPVTDSPLNRAVEGFGQTTPPWRAQLAPRPALGSYTQSR
jgi:hypothetical protein